MAMVSDEDDDYMEDVSLEISHTNSDLIRETAPNTLAVLSVSAETASSPVRKTFDVTDRDVDISRYSTPNAAIRLGSIAIQHAEVDYSSIQAPGGTDDDIGSLSGRSRTNSTDSIRTNGSLRQLSPTSRTSSLTPLEIPSMNDKTTSELQATIAATQSAIDGVLRKMNGELVLKERLKMKEKALMALAVDLAMGQGIHVSDDDLPVSDLEKRMQPTKKTKCWLQEVANVLWRDMARGTKEYQNRTYTNCFAGKDAVTWMMSNLAGVVNSRKDAVVLGQRMVGDSIIMHVHAEHGFRDKNLFYIFADDVRQYAKLDVPLNVRTAWPYGTLSREANDVVAELLGEIMDIYQIYVGHDGPLTECSLQEIRGSLQWRAFSIAVGELRIIKIKVQMSHEAKLTLYLNMYNLLILHGYVVLGIPDGLMKRIDFFKKAKYEIDGLTLSALELEHAILRAKSSPPDLGILGGFFLSIPKYGSKSAYGPLLLTRPEVLVSFALWNGAVDGPRLPEIFRGETVHSQLLHCARTYCYETVGLSIGGTVGRPVLSVLLPEIFQWFQADFGDTPTRMVSWLGQLMENVDVSCKASGKWAQLTRHHKSQIYAATSTRFREFDWSTYYRVAR